MNEWSLQRRARHLESGSGLVVYMENRSGSNSAIGFCDESSVMYADGELWRAANFYFEPVMKLSVTRHTAL